MASQERSKRYWGTVQPMPGPLIAAIAQQAEAQGLEGVFAAQVHGPPFLPLAVAAAATERIRLASGIAIAAARSPFETAMAAIDMDRISNGRFILGLGASVLSWTRGLYGAPEHKPLTHLRETVAAVRHIIAGAHQGLTPFEGQYYRADFEQLQPTAPPVREGIPIWIAALRGAAVRLGAEVADGIMGHPIWSIDWAVQEMQSHLKQGIERAGRRREDVGADDVQLVHVLEEQLGVARGELAQADALGDRATDRLVVDVRQVHDLGHSEALVLQVTPQQIFKHVGPEVANMCIVVHRRAARVHAYRVLVYRLERFQLPR